MTLRVPRIAPRLRDGTYASTTQNDIRAAFQVRGVSQWQDMAKAANWLAGCGGTLAVGMGDSGAEIAAGSSATRRAYVFPRSQHTTWVWTAMLRASTASVGARGTVTLSPGGTEYDFTLRDQTSTNFVWTHVPSSVATGEASIQIAVATNSPSAIRVRTIALYELPRHTLPSTSGTAGVHVDSCKSAQAIYRNTSPTDKYSIQAVYEQIRDAKDNCRRQAMFNWFNPTGIVTASGTFTNIFRIDPAIQTRQLTNGNTVGSVTCAAYIVVSTSTADIRFTAASGDSETISVSNTTAAWTTRALDVETDDFTQTGLVRGGTRDTITVEIRKTGAPGNVTVYGISIGEGT